MSRNMSYQKAPFLQKADANVGRGTGSGPSVPTHSAITKPPAVDPPGGTHIGTQMHGGIYKAAEKKI